MQHVIDTTVKFIILPMYLFVHAGKYKMGAKSMKFIVGIIIGVLVIIFMVQNVEVVDITFLAWTMHLPRAIMILIVFVLGIGVGYVARGLRARKKDKKEELENHSTK